MQSQQMYPEENGYSTFEPAFSEPSSVERDYREYNSGPTGEKLHPLQPTKHRGRWYWQRVVLAILSLLLLFVFSDMMLQGDNGMLGVLLVLVILFSVNIIVYLLSNHHRRMKGEVRQFGLRFALALVSGALLFPLSYMMAAGNNGPVGVLLVAVSILTINAIFYFTAFPQSPN